MIAAGCDRPRDTTPAPPVTTSAVQLTAPTPVPAPEVVLTPGSQGKSDEAARDRGRQEPDAKAMLSKEEESKSMPLAGQVNNHSSSADTTTAAPAASK